MKKSLGIFLLIIFAVSLTVSPKTVFAEIYFSADCDNPTGKDQDCMCKKETCPDGGISEACFPEMGPNPNANATQTLNNANVCPSPGPSGTPTDYSKPPDCPEQTLPITVSTSDGIDKMNCALDWVAYWGHHIQTLSPSPSPSTKPTMKPVVVIKRTPTPTPSPNPTPTGVPTAPTPFIIQTQPSLFKNFLTQAKKLINTFKGHFIYWLSKVRKGVKNK